MRCGLSKDEKRMRMEQLERTEKEISSNLETVNGVIDKLKNGKRANHHKGTVPETA